MAKTKLNNKGILLVVVLVAFIMIISVSKKEGIEEIDLTFKDFFNSNYIGIFAPDDANSDIPPMMILDMPITTTALAQSEIDSANKLLTDYGFSYTIPYSISDCLQYKSELQQIVSVAKNEIIGRIENINAQLNLFNSQDINKIKNNIQTNILDKIILSDFSSGSKRSIILKGPTMADIDVACNQFNIDFPLPPNNYSHVIVPSCYINGNFNNLNVEQCANNGGTYFEFSQGRIIQLIRHLCGPERRTYFTDFTDLTLYSVCENNFLFGTMDEDKYNNFIAYSGQGSGFGYYRNYYMNNLENGKLQASFVLDACFSNTDCTNNEVCTNFKCVDASCVPGNWNPSTSTISCGTEFTQVDNNFGTSRISTGTKGCSSGFGCSI